MLERYQRNQWTKQQPQCFADVDGFELEDNFYLFDMPRSQKRLHCSLLKTSKKSPNNTVADLPAVVDGRDEIEGALADFQGIKMLKAAEVTAIDVLISDAAEVDNSTDT